MTVSVEIPVFHHHFLRETIESVLAQSHANWKLYLLSDGATPEAEAIMRTYKSEDSTGKIAIYFQNNQGIHHARRRLTELSSSELILPLDHDDVLHPNALAEMVKCFQENESIGLVRARRDFIDQHSNKVNQSDWFPFETRKLDRGMTKDVFNHSQPFMFRRSAYQKTEGWSGFSEFSGAGEDCDIFLKLEEVSEIYLLDKYLYSYRLSEARTSHHIGLIGAKKMWCTLADQTIKRRGLPLHRLNDMPPFNFAEV